MKSKHRPFSSSAQGAHRVRADQGILSRTGIVGLLCGIVAFVPVLGMLANLMVFRHEEFSERALRTQSRTTTVTASRGAIYDRNMNVMAMSVSVENVYLAPRELRDSGADLPAVAQALGEILQIDPETIQKKAEDRTLRYQQIAAKQPRRSPENSRLHQ